MRLNGDHGKRGVVFVVDSWKDVMYLLVAAAAYGPRLTPASGNSSNYSVLWYVIMELYAVRRFYATPRHALCRYPE